ncbi:hypothetical protein GCM10018953_30640 [Streptosporangium nondiastaticum]
MASVRFGRPESRTTRTASATSSPTSSPAPIGVTLNATSTDMTLSSPGGDALGPAGQPILPTRPCMPNRVGAGLLPREGEKSDAVDHRRSALTRTPVLFEGETGPATQSGVGRDKSTAAR